MSRRVKYADLVKALKVACQTLETMEMILAEKGLAEGEPLNAKEWRKDILEALKGGNDD